MYRVCADVNELSRRAAEAAVTTINDAVRSHWQMFARAVGRKHAAHALRFARVGISRSDPVDTVHMFWGDERYVPPDDPDSNYRMAKETLLDHVPCPAGEHPPDADALPVTGRCRPRL